MAGNKRLFEKSVSALLIDASTKLSELFKESEKCQIQQSKANVQSSKVAVKGNTTNKVKPSTP